MTALLEVRGLGYGVAGRQLVDGVDLEVASGEVVVLVGPNGAGKTTAVRLIAGDVAADRGDIRLGEALIGSLDPLAAARRRSVMSQRTTVRFPFTAFDVVMMGRFAVDSDRATDVRASQLMMERTDTADLADAFFPVLSGGEQARVNLARTLVQEAPLAVLDEPTSSLDLRHQQLVMRLLGETAASGNGCLVVMHDLNLAAGYADRVALMHRGRIVATGSVEEVFEPELLSEVYQQPLSVVPHPQRPGPLVLVREG
jgi:iron complex transport system ATP-binding protein